MDHAGLNIWVPAIFGLAGTLVGAIASLAGTLMVNHSRQQRESKCVATALVTEVLCIREIANARRYQEGLIQACAWLRQQPQGTMFKYIVAVPDHYSRIYQANASRIGLIDSEVARKIVKFHQLADAVVQDVKPGGVLAVGAGLAAYEEAARILGQALDVADSLEPHT